MSLFKDMKFTTLVPPFFDNKGPDTTCEEAIENHLWIATVNLWVLKTDPTPSIVYQVRSKSKKWAPGKLDVLVGGKVDAGENFMQALQREANEEIGVNFDPGNITFIGKNLHVGIAGEKFVHTVPHIHLTIDNRNLKEYKMIDGEVEAIVAAPLDDLINLFEKDSFSFTAKGIDLNGEDFTMSVNKEKLPENWDDYHYKIAKIAKRYIAGEKNLVY